MRIEKIPEENISQFTSALERILRSSTTRRGFGFSLTIHSNKMATVTIRFSGKVGEASQKYVLTHDNLDGWIAYYLNAKIYLDSLSEISNLNQKIMSKLVSSVRKLS